MIKYKQLEDKEWLENKLQTLPMRHIAKELGCSYSGVHYAVKKFGITVPERRGYIYTEESRKAKSEAIKASLNRSFPEGRFGDQASNWRGGRRSKSHGGYIRVYMPSHPNAVQGSVFEHTVVAEKNLERYITKDEVVHHINGKKDDNRPENLQVMLRKDHIKMHQTSGENIQALHIEIARLKALLDKHNLLY